MGIFRNYATDRINFASTFSVYLKLCTISEEIGQV